MVSRQGICAFNGIVRRGQAGRCCDGLAAGFTATLATSHAILNGGASALTLEHVNGSNMSWVRPRHF
jgi:hypothetical protein